MGKKGAGEGDRDRSSSSSLLTEAERGNRGEEGRDGMLLLGAQRAIQRGELGRRCLDQREPLPDSEADRRGGIRLRLPR